MALEPEKETCCHNAESHNLVGLHSTTLTRWPTLQAQMLGLTQCTNCVSKQTVGPIQYVIVKECTVYYELQVIEKAECILP